MVEVKLGNTYEDTVTGFKGIAINISQFIGVQHDMVTLSTKATKDGITRELYISVDRLKLVTKEKVKKEKKK